MLVRIIELIGIFFCLPTLHVLGMLPVHLIVLLVIIAAGCLIVLLRDRAFARRQLWNRTALGPELKRIVILYAAAIVLISCGVGLFDREHLFDLVRRSPLVWAGVLMLYPVISVYPQELVYRTFFFHRYRALFPGRWTMILANACAFSFMHIVLQNLVAVVLTFIAGILFAYTYERTRSTLAVACEHALYGFLIFTIGLARYFYHGSISLSRVVDQALLSWQ